jgi:arabinan endo-1,5-alpha-L-arabinosidase
MKSRIALLGAVALVSIFASKTANAQVGAPYIHDPSTIVECDGKYYTFGTGGGGLISEDGWTWNSGAVRPGGGAAPDALKIGDRYLVGYSATGGGLGGGHAGRILTMWNKTLDPESPDFAYTEAVEVAASLVDEDCDAIDVGFLLDPSTGRLFCTYGTYFGFIRQVELDPKTGYRLEGNEAIDVAIDCEASVMMYNNGWYYLLGTHGTCCDGVNATYNIVCGRSRNPNGPFIDNVGRTMIEGGGKMVAAAEERRFGAGHFGRYIVDDGVEKASFHWEADLDLSGRSTLAIRPLLWKNDWPEVGELVAEGTYEIESVRRGYALELAVDFVRAQGGMRGFGRGGDQPNVVIENQKLEEVVDGWADKTDIRIGDYMNRPHQRWSLVAVPEAGGYLGGPYFKIVIEGTDRALTATDECELESAAFTGADAQLWRVDQLIDGTYRIMPKAVPGCSEPLCLVSVADSTPTLAKYNFNSDNCKWNLKHFNALK